MRSLYTIEVVSIVLVVIGAITLGLMGVFGWNPLHAIFGSVAWLERLVYIVIGAAGVYTAIVTPIWAKMHRTTRQPTTTSGY